MEWAAPECLSPYQAVVYDLAAEAELVRKNLVDVDPTHIDRAESELLAADRSFFEVTDRQLNLEYVQPERREPLKKFCDMLNGSNGSSA